MGAKRQTGNQENALAAIAAGADVNTAKESTRTMFTPLMVAAREGHVAIADALLKAGANPNLGGREEGLMIVGPLMLAARHGHLEVVKQLLEAGAGADHAGRFLLRLREKGDSAIHEAARNGHAHVVALLLEAGANPRERSEWSGSLLETAVESGSVDTVRIVLAAGGKPSANKLRELLVEATASNHWDIVRELHAAFGIPSVGKGK